MADFQEIGISVIVPTCKPDIYVLDCLNSLKRQTFSKNLFEILLILNGDKEPYYDWLRAFIKTELDEYNIKLFYIEKNGVSNARNIGLEQAAGKYIAFIDDDDIVSENYLQKLYNIAKGNTVPLSYARTFTTNILNTANYYITDVYERLTNKDIKIIDVRSYFSSACYKLLDRDIIGTQRFDSRFQNGEDSLFMFLISNKIKDIQFTDKTAVYFRRIREDSLTTVKKKTSYIIKNKILLLGAYTMIYFKKPIEYHFLFYISRIFALLKR